MIEKRGLGRGLSALIPAREQMSSSKKEEVVFVSPEQIQPNPYQPRTNFNPGELEDLIASIREKGIIQPVLLRRAPNGFELIAGERRLRAAKALSLKELPAIIKDVKNEEALEIALIENIQRENLNPIEEAHAFKHLIEQFNFTQEKIAQAIGKARVTVANTLRLLKLPLEVQEALRKGELSFAHGKILLELADSQKQTLLARQVVSKGLSVKELEKLTLLLQKNRKPKAYNLRLPPQLKAIEEELQQSLGTKVRIIAGHRAGTVNIEFYSHNDLERIYRHIVRK